MKPSRVVFATFIIGLLAGASGVYLGLQPQLTRMTSGLDAMKNPTLHAFASVTLDSKSTVLLLLDFAPAICYRRAMCNATLTNVQMLVSKARSAGISILYTKVPIREISNKTGEAVIINDKGPDKFYGTVLESWLNDKQAKTVVIAGVATNGAVLYTALETALRGYTVVVPSDATASDSDYIQTYAMFQMLNQPGRSNPENKPLAPAAVTLSTVAQLQFK